MITETRSERLEKRNETIRKRYNQLCSDECYRSEYALDILEKEYLSLGRNTIWLIIRQTGYYKKTKRLRKKMLELL